MKRENRKHAIICLIFLLIFDVAAIAVYAVSQSDNRKSEKGQRMKNTPPRMFKIQPLRKEKRTMISLFL